MQAESLHMVFNKPTIIALKKVKNNYMKRLVW